MYVTTAYTGMQGYVIQPERAESEVECKGVAKTDSPHHAITARVKVSVTKSPLFKRLYKPPENLQGGIRVAFAFAYAPFRCRFLYSYCKCQV